MPFWSMFATMTYWPCGPSGISPPTSATPADTVALHVRRGESWRERDGVRPVVDRGDRHGLTRAERIDQQLLADREADAGAAAHLQRRGAGGNRAGQRRDIRLRVEARPD